MAASLGPSLPSLAEQTHVQLKQVSLLFTAVNLGYLIGALLGGRIFDRRPGHPVMVGSLLVTAASDGACPAAFAAGVTDPGDVIFGAARRLAWTSVEIPCWSGCTVKKSVRL